MLFIMCDINRYLFADNLLGLTAAALVLIYNTPWGLLVPDPLKSCHLPGPAVSSICTMSFKCTCFTLGTSQALATLSCQSSEAPSLADAHSTGCKPCYLLVLMPAVCSTPSPFQCRYLRPLKHQRGLRSVIRFGQPCGFLVYI